MVYLYAEGIVRVLSIFADGIVRVLSIFAYGNMTQDNMTFLRNGLFYKSFLIFA